MNAHFSGPVSDSVNSISEFMAGFVKTLSGGLDPANSKWLVDQSVYFQVLAVLVLLAKFYWEIIKENRSRKAEDRIQGMVSAIMHIGFKFLLIPLIVLAPALSGMIGRSTMSAFVSTTAAAKRIAEVGDGLIAQAGTYWDLTVKGGAQAVLGMTDEVGAKLTPEERRAAESIQKSYGAAGTELNNAKMAWIEAQTSGSASAKAATQRRLNDAQAGFNQGSSQKTENKAR